MMTKAIHTLDARDNIYLETIRDFFKLNDSKMYEVINHSFDELNSTLSLKGIKYSELKSALVPNRDRKEIAFVFDTEKIESAWYGLPVMTALLPLLDKKSSHSLMVGDYVGKQSLSERLFTEFSKNIVLMRDVDYQHHTQFYIVFINNLSDKMLEALSKGLTSFEPFVGYFDITYSSYLKTYLSTILVNLAIKNKSVIIQPHEDDRDNEENINISGYPFEEYGYQCKSVQSTPFMLFLSYKIERPVFEGFESDTTYSINAISKNVLSIADFKIQMTQDKLNYVLKNKADNIVRGGIENLNLEEFKQLISDRISDNYIYNLRFKEVDGNKYLLFNLIIETNMEGLGKPTKLMVGLEYLPSNKILKVTTIF